MRAREALWRALLVYGTALAAGALLTCAFAPLSLWPLAILCPALLMWLWEGSSARRAAWSGFWFGAGTFAFGTWWLYISIHDVAQAPIWLGLALVLALVLIMAAYHALLGWLSVRALPASGPWRWLVGLPALWLLIEWWRGWFLSGFPWLSLGYSQTDTALAGFAPVLGVYGLSALLLVGSGALLALLRATARGARPGRGAAAAAVAARSRAAARRLDASLGAARSASRSCRAPCRRTSNGRRTMSSRRASCIRGSTSRRSARA